MSGGKRRTRPISVESVSELLRVGTYVNLEAHAEFSSVELAETVNEKEIGLSARVYRTKASLDRAFYKAHPAIKDRSDDFWVVVMDSKFTEYVPINLYWTKQFRTAREAYEEHKEIVKHLRIREKPFYGPSKGDMGA